jgi:tetratricopeptide (TPR) repeat protein
MGHRAALAATVAAAIAISTSRPHPAAQGPGSPAGAGAAAKAGLTGGPQVARTYDAIMDARFTEMPTRLSETCPPAPREVCQLLSVVATWWRIQLNPHDRMRDEAFERDADKAIVSMDAWTKREPMRPEAWFYLGGSIGARAQWRVLRGQMLAAARDGKRIKSALERAIALDPALNDAYFGIGLYHYYAAVAPAAARMLRWLLLLPGGDREQGLQEMLRARNGGQLLRSEADYQLHLVYLWYEKQTPKALDLLTSLAERYPHNPHFSQQIAEIEDRYDERHAASLHTWEALLERARAGQVAEPDMTRARAQLGAALELYHLGQFDAAIPHLRAVIDSEARAPVGAEAVAQLQLGYIYDRVARRDQAIAAYRAALAVNPAGDPLKLESKARAGLRAPLR